jgi:hypothetical protein
MQEILEIIAFSGCVERKIRAMGHMMDVHTISK